jgi:hypothetical protein
MINRHITVGLAMARNLTRSRIHRGLFNSSLIRYGSSLDLGHDAAFFQLCARGRDGTSYHSDKQKRAAGGNPTDSRSVSYPSGWCAGLETERCRPDLVSHRARGRQDRIAPPAAVAYGQS